MRIIRYIILFSLVLVTSAYSEDKDNFGQLLFKLDLKKKLPESFVAEYLKQKPSQHFTWKINKIERYPNYFCIFVSEASVVGYKKYLKTFNNSGEAISSLKMSDHSDSDGSANNWTEYEFLTDDILLKKHIGVNSGYDPIFLTSYKLEFFDRGQDGKIRKIDGYSNPFVRKIRFFPEISKYKLQDSALKSFNRRELRLMRNEIFAHLGYIFKNNTLSNYFSTFNWYQPRLKSVSEILSPIEKHNIDIIRKVELMKNH